ncbi:MAG TPA: SRPBCC family protein [Burkholderiales bacterium]|nr:SRPBCC family protein [Burkholderiales bacterium]
MPMARIFPLALIALVASAPATCADIAVNVTRSGDAFQIEASAEFAGTVAPTWKVLTDYDRLAEFVPDMETSRVVSRNGNEAVVEQKGEARVLFFSFPIDLRLAVAERPYERVVSRAVAGNFREMRGTYLLETGQGRILLRYTGRMVPDFFVPPLIGTLALKHNVEASFRALVNEIERQNKAVASDR